MPACVCGGKLLAALRVLQHLQVLLLLAWERPEINLNGPSGGGRF